MDLTVEPSKLSATAETLAAAASGLTETLQNLDGDSLAMTNAWEGDAKIAYQALYARFGTDALAWADSLAKIAGALATLSKDYTSADEKGAAAMPH